VTDRYHSLTVVLQDDTRDDAASALIDAIMMMRGVVAVSGNVSDVASYVSDEAWRQAAFNLLSAEEVMTGTECSDWKRKAMQLALRLASCVDDREATKHEVEAAMVEFSEHLDGIDALLSAAHDEGYEAGLSYGLSRGPE
jgi:hypothetical protein